MFQTELQNYLRRLPKEQPKPTELIAQVRAWFLDALRKVPATRMKRVYEEWHPKLDHFVEFASNSTRLPNVFDVIQVGLESEFGVQSASSVEGLEASRILREFGWRNGDLRTYASENLLVTGEGERAVLSRLGQAFLGLTGADAVRWLLLIETERSTGPFDEWRASPELLRELVTDPTGISQGFDTESEELYWPYSDQTLARLSAMGICHRYVDGGGVQIASGYHAIVTKVVTDDPWRAVVRTSYGAITHSVIGLQGRDSAASDRELARMITHEVRNALVPARHQAEALLSGEFDRSRVERTLKGIGRVLHFVEELVTITEAAATRRTKVEVRVLAEEALREVDGAERVAVRGSSGALSLPREPLERALRNVVQNAVQATSASIEVSWTVGASHLELTVDDAGPGVPAELREKIFEDGFTTRAGGTGFGLAMTRKILRDLGGEIRCLSSPMGGARFVLAVPLKEATS